MLDKERLTSSIPVIEGHTEFRKGSAFVPHAVQVDFTYQNPGDKPTLDRLHALYSSTNKSFFLESKSSFTHESMLTKEGKRIENIYNYAVNYEGEFLIPWTVVARATNGAVLIDYSVFLERPDQSLTYKIRHTYAHELPYFRNTRKRIDGLPVFIESETRTQQISSRTDQGEQFPYLSVIKIKSRGAEPVLFDAIEGNSAILQHERVFEGRWYERWNFSDDNDRRTPTLQRVNVSFFGNWGSP